MKEIVTGACLLAISTLLFGILFATSQNNYKDEARAAVLIVFVVLFVSAVALGFSGCGIFIRGVFK